MEQSNKKASTRSLSKSKVMIFSFIPLLVLFTTLELIARVVEIWKPPMIMDIGLGFTDDSRLFMVDPQDERYMVTHPNKTAAFRNQRFLRRKEIRTYRIFFLGGSSVNYVDYELPNLAKRLEERFQPRINRVEIINCGGLSYGTHRLVLIAREIIQYQPDLVLIYSGHNEFEEIEQLHLARLQTTRLQKLLFSSALMRFVRDRIAEYQISKLQIEHNKRLLAQSLPDAGKGWLHVFTPEEIQNRMEAYRSNLAEIAITVRGAGADIIIATVPSNMVKPSLTGKSAEEYHKVLDLINEGRYEDAYKLGREILKNTSPRHQSSDRENEIIRSLAKELSIPLADVLSAVESAEPHGIPGETLFNDHCHLNPQGNSIMIKTFEQKIIELLESKLGV